MPACDLSCNQAGLFPIYFGRSHSGVSFSTVSNPVTIFFFNSSGVICVVKCAVQRKYRATRESVIHRVSGKNAAMMTITIVTSNAPRTNPKKSPTILSSHPRPTP